MTIQPTISEYHHLDPENKVERNSQLIVDMVNMAFRNLSRPELIPPTVYRDSRNWCTVTIGLTRGAGHTTAALQLMTEHTDAILIVPDGHLNRHGQILFGVVSVDVISHIGHRVFEFGNRAAIEHACRGISRSMVIFDEASSINKFIRDEIKTLCSPKLAVELQ